MNNLFGFQNSPQFEAALEETFKRFEEMPAAELLKMAREHADGDIAKFVAACADTQHHQS